MDELPTLTTSGEMASILADRLRTLRLLAGLKRSTLAAKADVSPASLKRFETTGKTSLGNLLKLAHALGRLAEFEKLLPPPPAASIAELEERSVRPIPKRGRR